MLEGSTLLNLGSRVHFNDGPRARVEAIEVDESWEILNLVVSSGLLRWKQRVRLPFSTAVAWSEAAVELSCTRSEAFSRKIPPIAAPSRPISPETPTALPEASIVAALVNPQSQVATSLILRLGHQQLRVPSSDVIFEGKTLRITAQPDTLPEHRSDTEIAADAWRLLRGDPLIMPDEFGSLAVSSAGGVLTLTGNVRQNSTKKHAEAIVSRVAGLTELHSSLKDDIQLEFDIAAQLTLAGIQRVASIYARSSLGEVVLFGRAPSAIVAADANKIAGRVEGVVRVVDRIEVDSASPAGAEPATVA